jgi:hypothetical protein
MMHDKRCIDAVGGFREDFGAHEDWELWLRISERYPIAHIKAVTCEFKDWRGGANISANRLEMLRTLLAVYDLYREKARGNDPVLDLRRQMLRKVERTCRTSGYPGIEADIVAMYERYGEYEEMARLCDELVRRKGGRRWTASLARALKKQGRLDEAIKLLGVFG